MKTFASFKLDDVVAVRLVVAVAVVFAAVDNA